MFVRRIGVGDEITETTTGGGFNVVPQMLFDAAAIQRYNDALNALRPIIVEDVASSSSAVTAAPEKKSSVTMVLLLAAAVGVGYLVLTAKPARSRRRT